MRGRVEGKGRRRGREAPCGGARAHPHHQIDYNNGNLDISGKKKRKEKGEGKTRLHQERTFGAFHRSITLAPETNQEVRFLRWPSPALPCVLPLRAGGRPWCRRGCIGPGLGVGGGGQEGGQRSLGSPQDIKASYCCGVLCICISKKGGETTHTPGNRIDIVNKDLESERHA